MDPHLMNDEERRDRRKVIFDIKRNSFSMALLKIQGSRVVDKYKFLNTEFEYSYVEAHIGNKTYKELIYVK